MLTNFMDPVIAAQNRLEEAVNRLEEAVAARTQETHDSQNAKLAVDAELDRLRAECASLQTTKRMAADRLDAAIGRLKGLIGG